MLFYRARFVGPIEVLDVSLSPVRPVRRARGGGAVGPGQMAGSGHSGSFGHVCGDGHGARLGLMADSARRAGQGSAAGGSLGTGVGHVTGLHGRVRVVLRYGPAEGPLRTHRGWLYTDLPPGRRLRLAGCQVDGGEVLLSLAPVPADAGRERLRDRFRLPFHLTSWGVEAVAGVRAEVFCIPTVRPGALVLRGRGAVVLETASARLVRAIPFCRRVAAELNAHLDWRARAAVEGVEVRVGPGGAVEGWLHVAVSCRGEPGPVRAAPWTGTGGNAAADLGAAGPGLAGVTAVAAVRKVDAAVKRLEAEVVNDGLALVSGAVELDVAWADRSGRGRWTCREMPFSTLLSLAGLSEGDRLEPVAQVERLVRTGQGADERVHLLLAVGLTGLRAVHLELGGAFYRAERVVGQAVATLELNEPLFPREIPPKVASEATSRRLELETGLEAPWTRLEARIRRAGGRAVLEVRTEPCGSGSDASAAWLDLPCDGDAVLSLAAVGPQAVIRACGPARSGGVEVAVPRGTSTQVWHRLTQSARWFIDADAYPAGVTCLLRCPDGLRPVVLPEGEGTPLALTVAGTAVPGAGLDRLWVETSNA